MPAIVWLRMRFCIFLVALVSSAVAACAPIADPATETGKAAILDKVNLALTEGDCAEAIAAIEPMLNSENTDNEVRMLAASAYGCAANLNLFTLFGDIASAASEIGGSGFWSLLSNLFPSTSEDRVVEAAQIATDVLMAALRPGQVIPQSFLIDPTGYNPASMAVVDRLPDANGYLVFISMATIGGIQSRFGAPDPVSFNKTQALSWTTATAVDADGCAYASAIVNFIDALGDLADNVTGTLGDNLQTIQSAFAEAIEGELGACNFGCQNLPPPTGVASNCTVTTSCVGCPMALRDRTQCQGLNSDQVSCAAAGIVNFINSNPVGWQGP